MHEIYNVLHYGVYFDWHVMIYVSFLLGILSVLRGILEIQNDRAHQASLVPSLLRFRLTPRICPNPVRESL